MSGMGSLLYIVFLIAIFWFLLIRPQQKQAKKRAEMLGQMKQGDRIVTIGGICGKVKAVTEKKVFVEIADGLTIEMLRTAVSQIVADEDDDEYEDDEYDEDDAYEYDEYEDEFEEEDKNNK